MQDVPGFKLILEKYNFGDELDFSKIKMMRKTKYNGFKGLSSVVYKTLKILFIV